MDFPTDWSAAKTWPICIVVVGRGDRNFPLAQATREAAAKAGYIVISPSTVSCVGDLNPKGSPYPQSFLAAVADASARRDRVTWYSSGLQGILASTRQRWNGAARCLMVAPGDGAILAYDWIRNFERDLFLVCLATDDYCEGIEDMEYNKRLEGNLSLCWIVDLERTGSGFSLSTRSIIDRLPSEAPKDISSMEPSNFSPEVFAELVLFKAADVRK